ncbi:MAG: hypothetical protein CSB24_03515 [Deltaproteobacteria bacterium]|nr:MAG: hypothetical protein CSB24_03515 [Deltaproteobacteria bacterium]
MDTALLDGVWVDVKNFLKDGLVDGTFWDKDTGMPISSHVKSRDDFVALFSQFIDQVENTLSSSGMPGLGEFFTVSLHDILVIVIKHSDKIFQGMVIDPNKTNMGILYNVVLPKSIEKTKQAMA